MKDLSVGQLERDRGPLVEEILSCGSCQGDLVKKNQAIRQDDPDGDDGESRSGIVVFQRNQQRFIPSSMNNCQAHGSKAGDGEENEKGE